MSEQRLTSHVPIRFPPEMIAAVRERAEHDGMTVSSWIRKVVRDALGTPMKAKFQIVYREPTSESLRLLDLLSVQQIDAGAQAIAEHYARLIGVPEDSAGMSEGDRIAFKEAIVAARSV